MKSVQIRLPGGEWLDAQVEVESDDGKILAVSVDEGWPAPFALINNRQFLPIIHDADGLTREMADNRVVELRDSPHASN